MDLGNLKKDLVNRGIEKGKEEIDKLKGQFTDNKTDQSTTTPPTSLAGEQDSGQVSSERLEQTGTTAEEDTSDTAATPVTSQSDDADKEGEEAA